MSFQVGIGSLGGTVFFQVGLRTPLQTMSVNMVWTIYLIELSSVGIINDSKLK